MALINKFAYEKQPQNPPALVKSIMENLHEVLNTTRFYGAFPQAFGMLDMREYQYSNELLVAMRDELQDMIHDYEPRLENVAVSIAAEKKPASVYFRVESIVNNSPYIFNLLVSPSNRHIAITQG